MCPYIHVCVKPPAAQAIIGSSLVLASVKQAFYIEEPLRHVYFYCTVTRLKCLKSLRSIRKTISTLK